MILELDSKELLRLSRARGAIVEVLDGCVWITEPGHERDAFVLPGMRYSVGGNGMVVIGADGVAGGGLSRFALWPPVWRWLRRRAEVIVVGIAEQVREQRTVDALQRLSDWSLRDIGLTRDQIASAARRAVRGERREALELLQAVEQLERFARGQFVRIDALQRFAQRIGFRLFLFFLI